MFLLTKIEVLILILAVKATHNQNLNGFPGSVVLHPLYINNLSTILYQAQTTFYMLCNALSDGYKEAIKWCEIMGTFHTTKNSENFETETNGTDFLFCERSQKLLNFWKDHSNENFRNSWKKVKWNGNTQWEISGKLGIPHRLSGYQENPENAVQLLLEITWKTHNFSMNRKCPQFLCHIHVHIIITYMQELQRANCLRAHQLVTPKQWRMSKLPSAIKLKLNKESWK